MSSQRGNVSRSRPQKHKNASKFSNTQHDTSLRTKQILKVSQDGLCARCREKIEWKIKYKKYKPLSQPATCTRCHLKMVKKAYYTICQSCATAADVCAKCGEKREVVDPFASDEKTQVKQQNQLQEELKMLTERQRRSFFRLQSKGKLTDLDSFNPKEFSNETEDSQDDSLDESSTEAIEENGESNNEEIDSDEDRNK